MHFVLLLLSAAVVQVPVQDTADGDVNRWQREAAAVTITRDDWGIAHVHGKTDADAVFGMIYAQAEDDFNRVETNYLTSMGRLAEAEGEKAVWQDLRMKLFIDPDSLRTKYAASPLWLQSLMNAWADGLNYYLHTHSQVKPRVITRYEPWMALSFTEGSIGGDITATLPGAQLPDRPAHLPPSPPAPTASPSLRPTPSVTVHSSSSTRTPRSSSGPSCK
jgi:acyl-homoserine-lactone acylase